MSVRKKRIVIIIAIVIAAIIVLVPSSIAMYKSINYSAGISHFDNEEYLKSVQCFNRVQNYKDSQARLAVAQKFAELESKYNQAELYLAMEDYTTAEQLFLSATGYRDASDRAADVHNTYLYQTAIDQYEHGQYEDAINALRSIPAYKDAKDKAEEIQNEWNEKRYNDATAALAQKQYSDAQMIFRDLGEYKDSKDQYNMLSTYSNLYSKFNNEIKKSFVAAKAYFDLLPSDYFEDGAFRYECFKKYIDYCGEYVYQTGNIIILDIDFYLDGLKLYAVDRECSALYDYLSELSLDDMRNDTTNFPPHKMIGVLAGEIGVIFDWSDPLIVDDIGNGVIHRNKSTITFQNGQILIDETADSYYDDETVQTYNKRKAQQ